MAQCPNVKVIGAREPFKVLNGAKMMGLCGGYCRSSSDCFSRSCPRCYYDVINLTYGCHA